mgnify:CR=1 FL=1
MRQPHDILGVPANASPDQIKAAYRQLAKRYHPDFNRGDAQAEARFKEITDAYQRLTAKRPEPKGTEARTGAGTARPGAANGAANGAAGFRQRSANGASRKEADQKDSGQRDASRKNAGPKSTGNTSAPKDPPPKREQPRREPPRSASFEEELKRAREPKAEKPAAEERAGAEDGASAFTGFFSGLRRAGRQAMGSEGQDEDYDLKVSFLDAALGTTRRLKLSSGKVLDVRIPAGLSDGQQIRLRGQGAANRFGSARGDALITVGVEPHDTFMREGFNISAPLPVPLADAVLGAKLRAPTIHGSVTVTVPAGSSSGRRLRLQGQGIRPASGGKAGDHYAVIQIMLPDDIDPALEHFIAGWASGRGERKDEA